MKKLLSFLALAVLTCIAEPASSEVIINPVAGFITLDGQFTNGVPTPGTGREWSDVTPLAFISPANNSGQLQPTFLGDPNANSLLYAALAPGEVSQLELYLGYDYLPRTNIFFSAGEFVADVSFPVTIGTERKNITVQIRGGGVVPVGNQPSVIGSFFDVFVVFDDDPNNRIPAGNFGIEAAVGFGPSLLSNDDHLLVELEVPLLIPADFGSSGGPFPPAGLPGGIYSPDPAFWGSNIANDSVDPPASAAVFTINPDGTTTIDSTPSAVPEPHTLLLLGFGMLLLAAWRRRVF
jgi:hypothetical protein